MNNNLLLLIAIAILSPFNSTRATRANPTQEELAHWRKLVAEEKCIDGSALRILAHHDSWKARFFSVDEDGDNVFERLAASKPLHIAFGCIGIGIIAGHPASKAITKFDRKFPLVLPNLRALSLAGMGVFTALNGLDRFVEILWYRRHPELAEKITQLMIGGMAIGSGACLLTFKKN